MKSPRLVPAILGASIAFCAYTALDAAPPDKPPADVEAGKNLYVKFCQKCHGPRGEGVPRMYQLVDAKIVHLGSKQAQAKSDAEIRKAMLDGVGKMEAVDDLTPQQAEKILAFVRTLTAEPEKK